MSNCYEVELHLQLSSEFGKESEEALRENLELALFSLFARAGGEFTGSEVGGHEAIYFVEVPRPAEFLRKIRLVIENLGILERIHAVIRWDYGTDDTVETVRLARLDEWERVQLIKPRRRRSRASKLYDYYAIPLPDGRYGHVHYITREPGWGDFVQVLDVILPEPASLDILLSASPRFPPLPFAISYCAKRYGYRFVGNRPPEQPVVLPAMRLSPKAQWTRQPGIYDDWLLYVDGQFLPIGKLGENERRLEFFDGWKPEDLARRIATGYNPFEKFR